MDINWDAVGAIGETLGAIGVILTLLYLTTQIRQNTKALRSQTYQSYRENSTELFDFAVANTSSYLELMSGKEELSPEAEVFTWALVGKLLSLLEATYLHYQEGAISKDFFESRLTTYKDAFEQARVQKQWNETKKSGFQADFVKFVDEQVVPRR